MDFIVHRTEKGTTVEIRTEEIVIHSEQDALEIINNIGYLYESGRIIIHKENLSKDFFDLKSGLAGDVLQKFSNYRVQLVVVGDFSLFTSKSLKDFIMESNKGHLVNFLPDVSAALN